MRIEITCHWIDKEWKLHEALLNFKYIEENHIEENLSSIIMKILDEYFIQYKLFCIIMNNAGNNKIIMKTINFSLQITNIEWNSREYHIIYFNYIINLMI